MGPMVNLAARLRNRAGSGQILVGSAAYRPTRGVFDCAALELVLPGFARPVTAYQVLRLRSHVTKERGVEGLRAELVGRDGEMTRPQGRPGKGLGWPGATGPHQWPRRRRQISPGGGAQGGLEIEDRQSWPDRRFSPAASRRSPVFDLVAGRPLPGAGHCHRLLALCGHAAPHPE